jgi:hypothetical protein
MNANVITDAVNGLEEFGVPGAKNGGEIALRRRMEL